MEGLQLNNANNRIIDKFDIIIAHEQAVKHLLPFLYKI